MCGELQVEIGCGNDKTEGFVGIDNSENSDADIVRDLRDGLPFCSNSTKHIKANSVLEHFSNDDFIKIMKECHRILIDGGILEGIVPYGEDLIAIKDPTHQRFFARETFSYFSPKSPKQKLYNLPAFETLDCHLEGESGKREIYFTLKAIK